MAKLWGIGILQEFLSERVSIWAHLCDYLGLPLTEDNKQWLKTGAIYPLCYVMTWSNVLKRLSEGDEEDVPAKGPELAEKLLAHPFLLELREGRQRYFARIRKEGYAVNAFDDKLELLPESAGRKARGERVRSVAAQVVQSYELEAMLELLPVLSEFGSDVHPLSFLHDGMTISFGDAKRKALILRRLCARVKSYALTRGFHLVLESEDLGPKFG